MYKANSSNEEWRQTVPNFKNSYIASNLDIIDPDRGTQEPLAPRFRKFETKNQKIRVLSFGFLFDFTGNADNTIVQPVEDTIEEEWFKKALQDHEVDVIIVIGHVGVRMNEFSVIFKAIRDAQWDTPILFFGGHVHVRDYTTYDSNSAAIASGRYMETVGFLSVDGIPGRKKKDIEAKRASIKFSRRYIDNNLVSYYHHSGKNESNFQTDKGKKVGNAIAKARKALDLGRKYGCAPETLYVNRAPYPSNSSIFSWLADSVFPTELAKTSRVAKDGKKALVLSNTGSVRFDIFKGPFTSDTEFLVSPFTSGLRFVPDVPLKIAARILELLNGKGPIVQDVAASRGHHPWRLPPPEQAAILQGRLGPKKAERIANTNTWQMSLQKIMGFQPITIESDKNLRPGYTTVDDMGNDGDDTEHAQIDFYVVPNAIQAAVGLDVPSNLKDVSEDDTVDVVYNEFLQPWIIMALQYLGKNVEESDTAVYYNGKTMTSVLTDWIHDNWKC